MTRENLLDMLAQHRQHLDATYRAITTDLAAEYPDAHAHIAIALDNIAEALAAIDTPTVTPESPWIGSTMPDRIVPPTYTTSLEG